MQCFASAAPRLRSDIPETMRGVLRWPVAALLFCAVLAAATALPAQQTPDPFRWMDFHSEKDQDVIVWVTRSLAVESWTSIREIGVQYDAALVVTTNRATPQASPDADTFTIWSVSLTNHALTLLLKGVNLRWLDGMTFAEGEPQELAALYDNCTGCAPDTYFTTFHYDSRAHTWATRWMRGGQGVPLWSANGPPGVDWTQVYAGLAEPNGRAFICTWSHFDYGKQKPEEDVVYRFDLAPGSGLDRTQLLSGKDADAMKLRVCRSGEALPGLARGQDSELCQQLVNPRPARKPVTTPPANNHGKSVPGGHSHQGVLQK
jgi:hypothetical protein